MDRNIGRSTTRDRAPAPFGWVGAWAAVLAVPLWATQLSAAWLLAGVAGAAVWTVAASRRRGRLGIATAAALWATLGTTAGVQYRLTEIAGDWPRLQREIEESAAGALNASLDELVVRGERAVGAVEAALEGIRSPAAAPLFERLGAVRAAEGVDALALFDGRGAPVAWAGEHRGAIPLSARLGRQAYVYHEGPLFSYLYFTRPLEGGRTVMAAVLLESTVPVERGEAPFAEQFAERTGLTPRFYMPQRARGAAVWDWSTDHTILSASFVALTQQHWWERVVDKGRRAAGVGWVLTLVLLSVLWYASRMPRPGVPVAVGTMGLVLAPLGQMFGSGELFSPLQFVLPLPGDATLGVLLTLLVGLSVWVLTRFGGREAAGALPLPVQGAGAVLVLVGVLALVDRSATDGLLASTLAGGFPLQLAATLMATVPTYLLLRGGRRPTIAVRPAVLMLAAGVVAAVGGGLGLLLWWEPGRPTLPWTPIFWLLPFILLAAAAPVLFRQWVRLRSWLLAGAFAASAVLPHLWVMHTAAELETAEVDLARLGTDPDPFLDFLLRQFADSAAVFAEQGESGVNLLYHSWVASGLAAEGHEAHLATWRNGRIASQLALSRADSVPPAVEEWVVATEPGAEATVMMFSDIEALHYLLVAPLPDGRIVSVAVPPRSRLGRTTPLARFLHPRGRGDAASYNETLYLIPAAPSDTMVAGADERSTRRVSWTRTEAGWRSEARAHFPGGWMHAHLFVRTSALPLVLVRATLGAAALIAVLLALWLLSRLLCGEVEALRRLRAEWLRSFRGRLTVTLFLFFLIPTAIFGAVAYGAVAREVVLSAAAQAQRALEQAGPSVLRERLPAVGSEVGTDLLLYQDGLLVGAAAPETIDLGLFHSWLSPRVYLDLASGEDTEAQENRRLGENEYLVAYRRLDPARVLAAPIPLASQEITRRQREFRDIALLVSLLGAAFSIFLSLQVARALSRPLAELSRAAVTVGGGDLRVSLPPRELDEFGSVYQSFNRMVQRLRRARTDLAREARRTETIVAEAATGVLALDASGRVELVNPRAAEILGVALRRGERLPRTGTLLSAVNAALREFRRSSAVEAGRELEVDARIVRLRLRKIAGAEGPRGTVVALEDVTSEVRSARVLAWGEMARQVAHEIKNPLTPIKLSVQHLRRAYADRRDDFGEILDRNVEGILDEIDRLGEIARAFARFGAPQQAEVELERVDATRTIAETLALYRSGGTGEIRVVSDVEAGEPLWVTARAGELKEVLINLLENAREALDGGGELRVAARRIDDGDTVEIAVEDNGEGIPPELLQRVFDPHFSTRTSGTGLGLAIVKRLVDSWGGTIAAESEVGVGTRVVMRLRDATSGMPLAPGSADESHAPTRSTEQREEDTMGDLKKGEQRGSGQRGGTGAPGGVGEPRRSEDDNRGAEFGTSERATRGTDRDADRSGESKNQGHGHPREERGE